MPTTPYALLLTLLAGSIAQAQDTTQADPSQAHQRIEIITGTLPKMGTDQTPIEPTEPNLTNPHQVGLTKGQDWMKVVHNTIGEVIKPSSLAEGSFVLSRSGRLVPAPNDRLIFVPAPDQRLPGEGPVLLLPCSTLERLESIWANQPIIVSGEILTYHGRNHLLISDFALGVEITDPASPVQIDEQPENSEQVVPADDDSEHQLDEDPGVLDLLRELDAESAAPSGAQLSDQSSYSTNARRNQQSSRQKSSGQLQIAPPALAPGMKEGTLLVRRPARLDRAPDGSWMATFDNDEQNTPDGIELTMLPCALLMTMENQAIRFGDSARFVVSGRLYIHNDRGYLLPSFYQRLRTSDIKPWQ